jgi:hypothetical protein
MFYLFIQYSLNKYLHVFDEHLLNVSYVSGTMLGTIRYSGKSHRPRALNLVSLHIIVVKSMGSWT